MLVQNPLRIYKPLRRTRLKLLHDETDRDIKLGLNGQPVSCTKGCAHCCYLNVATFYLEACAMVYEARRVGFTIDRMRLDEDAKRIALIDPGDNDGSHRWLAQKRPCTFLRSDNTCAVYRARPTQCRQHAVQSPPELCAQPNAIISKYDARGTIQRAYARLHEEHRQLGIAPVIGPLQIMVRAVLNGVPAHEVAKMRDSLAAVAMDERVAADAERKRAGTLKYGGIDNAA